MLKINEKEITFRAIRAQGAGGQHVNKVSSAIQLQFDIKSSSLPAAVKHRLLTSGDQRVSKDGVLMIKSQCFKSQRRNREDALLRLEELIEKASAVKKYRIGTKPTRNSQKRRLDSKTKSSRQKALRKSPKDW